MNRTMKLLASVSALGAAALVATPAFAQVTNGTDAGTEVTNTVTLKYKVGGIQQTDKTDDDKFVVDRKIIFLVSNSVESGDLVDTTPGKEGSVQTFTVTNSTNETVDLLLELTVREGGAFGTTASGYTMYSDEALETAITYLDEMEEGETRPVYVVYTPAVPIGSEDGDKALIRLSARAGEGGTADAAGTAFQNSTGADDPEEIDNVFAEGENSTVAGNEEFNGVHWDDGGFEVQTAAIAVTKTSTIISDPVNNEVNPKAIPQAVVEYCILVVNGSDTAATNLVISDPVPATMTYVENSAKVGGANCSTPGTTDGLLEDGAVTGEIATLNGGATQTLIFRATIN